jgi:phosphoesterase RecJ-like protein
MNPSALFLPPPELLELLHGCRRPLLIAHLSPDGDTMGSLCGLGLLLHQLGKEPTLACQDRVPSSLGFLPFSARVANTVDVDADLVVALDCSDAGRLGSLHQPRRQTGLPLVVIDHHVTNLFFGDINWVEPRACATAELIYDLALALDAPIDADVAACLLTGLVTDTRGFRTDSTTARTLDIAATLMAAGASLFSISSATLDARSYTLVQLWGRALATVRLDGAVISVLNTRAMRADLHNLTRVEGLASFLLGANEADIAAVFTELPEGEVECSFRAQPGHNVAALALELGGGGHPLAAGCTVRGQIDEVRQRLVARLRSA